MFYLLFKKVIEKVNKYDKCSKNPFESTYSNSKKHIKFTNKCSNEPARTYVWIEKDD